MEENTSKLGVDEIVEDTEVPLDKNVRLMSPTMIFPLQLRQCGATDFRTVKQGLIGRRANGIEITTDAQCQTQIGCRIDHSFLTDTGREVRRLAEQRRTGVQRFNVHLADFAAAPGSFFAHRFMIGEHCRIGIERGCIVVLTG